MTMTEKKHAIKPYPLGAHVEDGAIRFAYASGKKDSHIRQKEWKKNAQGSVSTGGTDGKCVL